MAKRKSTMITNEKEIDYILNLTPKECQKLSVFMGVIWCI